MTSLVVYDSVYGNTESIARAVADALGHSGAVRLVRAGGVSVPELRTVELLVVGSPTLGGQATPAIRRFLGMIPADALSGVRVACFDTRMDALIAKLFGYAATRIADRMVKRGGELVGPPTGFIVRGREGPLREGEQERASTWAQGIATGRG